MTQDQHAQQTIDALEAQYGRALAKAQGKAGTDVDGELLGALRMARGKIDKLKGPYREWARAGQRDGQLGSAPGSAYSWTSWDTFAGQLSDEVKQDSGIAGDLPGPLLDAVTAAGAGDFDQAAGDLPAVEAEAAAAVSSGFDTLKTAALWVGVGGGLLLILAVVVAVRKAV